MYVTLRRLYPGRMLINVVGWPATCSNAKAIELLGLLALCHPIPIFAVCKDHSDSKRAALRYLRGKLV